MIFRNQSHLEMLTSLLEHHVEYLIVGGYAVILHGYVRTTGDMDIWVKPSPENIERLLDAFSHMQFDPQGIEQIRNMDFTKPVVFHIGGEPDRIDFLSHIAGVDFAKAHSRHESILYQHYHIPYIHLDDLIINKLRSNRLQDQADVEALQKIARIKKA